MRGLCVVLFVCSLSNYRVKADEILQTASATDKILTVKLYHSFETTEKYYLRGTIVIQNGEAYIKQDQPLSIEEIAALKKAASVNGNYHLKAVAYKNNEEDTKIATTFLKACSILESGLSDIITVSLDQNGNFLAASISSTNPYCIASSNVIPSKLTQFNTSLDILQTIQAPIPDTQTYIHRLEQEKAEKLRGDKGDNRSFLAKYWIYIVPVVIFLMISSATNAEAQGGSGGGR
ncbi:secreted protein-like protein [Leptotrombidium deliense]|uniref:ER membrane protein complex subunit 10 n=1 Tax=Leptotrombidium deliense TaxID=299467 RepID=A0A443S777_9ACAR|nr:secreted protein-like protein [Leptotrombidium deliense]